MARASRPGASRDGRMSLGAHLRELRRRLVWVAGAILLGAIAGYFLSNFVITELQAPIAHLAHQQHRLASLNYQGITDAFDVKLEVGFTIGVVISSPVWLYQIWAFFVPALTRRELKYALGFFLTSVPLFLAGCAAGWYVVPHIVDVLTSFAPSQSASFIEASDYLHFIMKLMLAIGIAFVLPVFLVLLNFVGVLRGAVIIRAWRVAVLLIVLFAAIATPSADVISMFLLAIPMAALYFAAAGISLLHDRRARRVLAAMPDSAFAVRS